MCGNDGGLAEVVRRGPGDGTRWTGTGSRRGPALVAHGYPVGAPRSQALRSGNRRSPNVPDSRLMVMTLDARYRPSPRSGRPAARGRRATVIRSSGSRHVIGVSSWRTDSAQTANRSFVLGVSRYRGFAEVVHNTEHFRSPWFGPHRSGAYSNDTIVVAAATLSAPVTGCHRYSPAASGRSVPVAESCTSQ